MSGRIVSRRRTSPLSDEHLHFSHSQLMLVPYFKVTFIMIYSFSSAPPLADQSRGPTSQGWKRVCPAGVSEQFIGGFDWTDAWNSKMEHYHKEDWDRVKSLWNVKYVINHESGKTESGGGFSRELNWCCGFVVDYFEVFFFFRTDLCTPSWNQCRTEHMYQVQL